MTRRLDDERRALVERSLGLVGEELSRFEGQADYEDLYATGCLALCSAAAAFGEGGAAAFEAEARRRIRRQVRRYMLCQQRERALSKSLQRRCCRTPAASEFNTVISR